MATKTAKAPPWSKVLIANRGEIAVRIAASLRALDLQPIAIYSSADATALHVQRCDQAFWVGPAAPQQSYLRADRIVAAARQAGADAVHPGYGFLAENADFATAVAAAGMTFIGPPPAAIRAMGNKTRARELMQAAGVPTVPGGEIGTDDALLQVGELAARVGYPIMLKAAAGGGGKGMRRVTEAAALGGALLRARSEAQTAFGDATVYIEKYLAQPRHIEVQIVGDVDGRIVVLGDRECSMQRRHQKVIEESPAAHLAAPLRARLHAVAAQAAAAVDYRGAGTVEFLVDGDALYFLEMNTRLQVEHGVTEACFGVDLVAAQLRVAQGLKLGWQAGALHSRGHAIEARLYAEDPRRDFLPCPGNLASLEFFEAPGIRVDRGVVAPCAVSPHYDPLLAKVIAHGETRELARMRLLQALRQLRIGGLVTNVEFLQAVLQSRDFVRGRYHTATLGEQVSRFVADGRCDPDGELLSMALGIYAFGRDRRRGAAAASGTDDRRAWQEADLRLRSG